MKNLFLFIFLLATTNLAVAQNWYPTTGNVGIGTTSPGAALDINANNAQLKLRGAAWSFYANDIDVTRTSSSDQFQKSPNIALRDNVNGAMIQSFQGNLQFWPGFVKQVTMTATGLVGINTPTPVSTFQVNDRGTKLSIGTANTAGLLGTSYVGFNVARRSSDNMWVLDYNTTGAGSGGAIFYGDVAGNLNLATIPTLNGLASAYLTDADLKTRISFQVTSGGVTRAKRLKVETTGWPDYVFSKKYKLPSLSSVNAYIQKKRHLPDMPSAKEVHADGQDVGEMNKLLLKKVEELTLYLIEKDGQFNKLKKEQQAQQEKNNQQQALLEELKSAVSVLKAQQKK